MILMLLVFFVAGRASASVVPYYGPHGGYQGYGGSGYGPAVQPGYGGFQARRGQYGLFDTREDLYGDRSFFNMLRGSRFVRECW